MHPPTPERGCWLCFGETSIDPREPEAWGPEQLLSMGAGKDTDTSKYLLCAHQVSTHQENPLSLQE